MAPEPSCLIEPRWPWAGVPGVVVAQLDLQRHTPAELLERLGEPLPERVARAAAKRKAEYAAGRLCARQALLDLTGSPATPGMHVDGGPAWPAGVSGSISHGAGQAVAVVASARLYSGLGVDVEEVLPPTRARDLAPEILTPDERRRFADREPGLLNSTVFSLKESLFKALNPLTGVLFFHQDAEVTSLENGRAGLRLLRSLGPRCPAGSVFRGRYHASSHRLFSLITVPASRTTRTITHHLGTE